MADAVGGAALSPPAAALGNVRQAGRSCRRMEIRHDCLGCAAAASLVCIAVAIPLRTLAVLVSGEHACSNVNGLSVHVYTLLTHVPCADWACGRVLQAAARLGVSVFASAPLAEGGVLRNEKLKARPCWPQKAGHLVAGWSAYFRPICRGKRFRVSYACSARSVGMYTQALCIEALLCTT